MAWNDLKASIAAVIKTNGTQAITGALLQSTLNSIIDQVGANASYKGVAIPSTNPGTPDALVFYIASTQGTYANFGGFVLDGGFAVLSNVSGSWSGTKFLKTEMDAKANHGYDSAPKTLKAVDEAKVDKTSIVGETGQGETSVMHQKAVTDELGTKASHGYEAAEPKTLKQVDDSVSQLESDLNLKASKTFLIEESINRFDKSTVIPNTLIVSATGQIGTSYGYFTSAWIPVTGDEMYYLSGRTGQPYVRFKKADETIIKPVDATTGAELPNYALRYIVGKVKAPPLAVAFQFTSSDAGLNTAQFEKGEVATTYKEYGVGLLKDGFVSGKQNKSAPTLPTTSKTIEGAIAEIHNNKKTAINDSDTEYPTSKAVLTADNLRILKADSVNNLITTIEGKVADARTVKTLNDNKAERTELPPFAAFPYYLEADTETMISGSDFSPALTARPASISVFSGGEEVYVSKRYIRNGDYYDVYLTSETEITDIEVSVVGAKTAQPLTFDNGKVIFDFDDSAISMYNEGLPAFQSKGATATLYTNGILADGTNPNYCRWPELLAMHNAGLDIQCHTYNHYRLTEKTEAEIHADLQQQNAAFVAGGLPAPQHLAFPEGLYNDVAKDAVSAYRKTARCSAPYYNYINRGSDKYALTSYWIENTTPEKVAIAKAYMDEVQAKKGVLMLSGHGVTATGEQDTITTAYLLELIDYANMIGIDIINVSQLYKLMMLNYVHPRTELTLTATGTGVGVATLIIVVSEDTIVKVGGGAKMYTDAAGTLNESEERQLYAGQSTIYIRQATEVGYISLEHDRITQIRVWSSAVNAPSLGGDISLFGNLNYINIGNQNTIEGSITDMVKLSDILVLGMNTLSGDISNLNSLANLRIEGANTVTGNVENLTNLKIFIMGGNYSIYGDLSVLTKLHYIGIFGSPKLLTISNVTNIKGLCTLMVFGIELTSTNVNQLLSDFWLNKDETKPIASRQILINGNAYSGAPTGQGLIDKAALQAYRSPNNDAQYALWTVSTR